MTESTEKEKDTAAEELAKKEKILDWLWDGPTKRTVLGLLKGRRSKRKKHNGK